MVLAIRSVDHPATLRRTRRAWYIRDVLLSLMYLAVMFTSGGCRSTAHQSETSHLKPLVVIYGQYLSRNGVAPENENVFKEFVSEHGMMILEKIGIENVDDLFVSERDGQPYVVLYGNRPSDNAGGLVAHEQSGIDGKRLVGYSLGLVAEVDEAAFRELVAP